MTLRYLQGLNAEDAADAHRRFSPVDNMWQYRNLESVQARKVDYLYFPLGLR
jgi:hypothetical protein